MPPRSIPAAEGGFYGSASEMSSEMEAGLLSGSSKNRSYWSIPLIVSVSIACCSSIQFGYHMSELNAPESVMSCNSILTDDFQELGLDACIPMNSNQIGMITSIFSIGGLLSSIFAGSLSDKYGRQKVFIMNSIIYSLGSFIEYFANSYMAMLIGRFISGVSAGSGLVIVPIYINEISPIELRGLLGSMNQVCVNFGILLTQVLAIKWTNLRQWRLLLLVGGVLGIINLIGSVFFLYESPKWLIVSQGDDERGKLMLIKLRNSDKLSDENELIRIYKEIEIWKDDMNTNDHDGDNKSSISMMTYLKQSKYNKSKIISSFIMIGQQFCGINSIIFYGVKVVNNIFPNYSILINCMISFVNMAITFVSSLYLDQLGRKPMLLISILIMGISSVLISVSIIKEVSNLLIIALVLYIGSFAVGCGPIPFLLISEVSQLEVKAVAQSFATYCNFLSTFLIGFLFPLMNQWIGGYVYLIFSVICFVFFMFITRYVPETKGKNSYQEVWGLNE